MTPQFASQGDTVVTLGHFVEHHVQPVPLVTSVPSLPLSVASPVITSVATASPVMTSVATASPVITSVATPVVTTTAQVAPFTPLGSAVTVSPRPPVTQVITHAPRIVSPAPQCTQSILVSSHSTPQLEGTDSRADSSVETTQADALAALTTCTTMLVKCEERLSLRIDQECKERVASLDELRRELDAQRAEISVMHGEIGVVGDQTKTAIAQVMSDIDSDKAICEIRKKFVIEPKALPATPAESAALRREIDSLKAASGAQADRLDLLAGSLNSLSRLRTEVRADLEAETEQRVAAHDDTLSKLGALASDLDAGARRGSELWQELREVQASTEALEARLGELRHDMIQETAERKSSVHAMNINLQDIRQGLMKEIRDRSSGDEHLARTISDSVEQEKQDRHNAHRALCLQMSDMQQEPTMYRASSSEVKAPVQEKEDTILAQLQDHWRSLERETNERVTALQRVEKRCIDLSASIDNEGRLRSILAEEVEQVLRTQRTKLRNLIQETGEALRAELEGLRSTFQEQLEHERLARTEHQDVVAVRFTTHQSSIESLRSGLTEVEVRVQDGRMAWESELATHRAKAADELSSQVCGLRELVEDTNGQTRAAHVAWETANDERLSEIELFLDNFRDTVLGSLSDKWRGRHRCTRTSPLATDKNTAVTDSARLGLSTDFL